MPKSDFYVGEMRSYAGMADVHVPDVSSWNVGMHIQHCSLAINGICEALENSSPPVPKSRFSPIPSLIFLLGRIPRGRGQSPDIVMPRKGVTSDELDALLTESAAWLGRASRLDPNKWFKHFAFGPLARDKALKFIRIHNHHHLRIIDDIAAAAQSTR